METANPPRPPLFAWNDGEPMLFRLEDSIAGKLRRGLEQNIADEGGTFTASPAAADYIIALPAHTANATKDLAHLRELEKPVLSPEWVTRCIWRGMLIGAEDEWGGFSIDVDDAHSNSERHAHDGEYFENNDLDEVNLDQGSAQYSSIEFTGISKGKGVRNRSPTPVEMDFTSRAYESPPLRHAGRKSAPTMRRAPVLPSEPSASQQSPHVDAASSLPLPMNPNPAFPPGMFMNSPYGALPGYHPASYMNPFGSMMPTASAPVFTSILPVVALSPDVLARLLSTSLNMTTTYANDGVVAPRTTASSIPDPIQGTNDWMGRSDAQRAPPNVSSRPLSSRRVASPSAHIERDSRPIFVSPRGEPLYFYMPSELDNGPQLCKLIEMHGGVVQLSLQDSDFIILTPQHVASFCALAPNNDKTILCTSWVEACVKHSSRLSIDKYKLVPPKNATTRVTFSSHHASPGASESSLDEEEAMIAGPAKAVIQRRRRSSVSVPKEPLELPKPPTKVVPAIQGNLYTEEDDDYLVKVARIRLAQEPSLPMTDILKEVADKTPHHNFNSWTKHYKRKKHILDTAIETGRRTESRFGKGVTVDENERTSAAEATNLRNAADKEDPYSAHLPESKVYTIEDFRNVVKHVADNLAPNEILTSMSLWTRFYEHHPSHSPDGWVAYVRLRRAVIEQAVEQHRRRQLSSSTHHRDNPAGPQVSSRQVNVFYTEQDFKNVVDHLWRLRVAPSAELNAPWIWIEFALKHTTHSQKGWAEYVRRNLERIRTELEQRREAHNESANRKRQGSIELSAERPPSKRMRA